MKSGETFERILVICTRQIGDVLLTTPLIQATRARWPRARIDVLGFAGTLGMLRGNPEVGELVEVQPGSNWLQSLSLIRRLWRRYDLALVTQRSDRAHLYCWIAARARSGLVPGNRSLAWWKRLILDHALVVNGEDTHIVVEKLRLLEPWVDAPAARVPDVVAPATKPLPPDLAGRLGARYAVVHVPSMWRFKQWPPRHFATLVQGLLGDGLQVVLSGSGAAVDQARIAEVRALVDAPGLLDASGRLDLGQLTTLLAGAVLYVGPDTSITHLAAACSLPVVALFGPTQPQVWGPWPQGHAGLQPWVPRALAQRAGPIVILQGPGACVPCSRSGCENHVDSRADCLEHLGPERVLAEARALLAAVAG